MEVPESPRFFMNHCGTTMIHSDVSMVLLGIIPIHHNLLGLIYLFHGNFAFSSIQTLSVFTMIYRVKHMFCVRKRKVSGRRFVYAWRRFFYAYKTYF